MNVTCKHVPSKVMFVLPTRITSPGFKGALVTRLLFNLVPLLLPKSTTYGILFSIYEKTKKKVIRSHPGWIHVH